MTTITFDTMEIADRLQKAGATPEYAKAEAAVLRDVVSVSLEAKFATHDDIVELTQQLNMLETTVDAKFDKVYWMLGIIVALAIANFAKQFF